MDVACDGGAEAESAEGVVGLGESEAEHAESAEGEEKREEGSPGGGEENGDGHEGTEGEEDEADSGGNVSGETGAESEAFGEHAWSGGRRRTEFHAGQRGHGSATGVALALPRGVVGVAPAAGDHGGFGIGWGRRWQGRGYPTLGLGRSSDAELSGEAGQAGVKA